MIVSTLDDADEQACEKKKRTYGSPRESYTCGTRPSAGARPTCGVPGAHRVHVSAMVGKADEASRPLEGGALETHEFDSDLLVVEQVGALEDDAERTL